ncbi:MAG: M23 family metallopeptidase [Chitinophagaceae bacterium]
MKKIFQTILFIFSTFTFAIGQEKISIMPNPQKIWIELGESKKYVNFDFLVQNNSSDTLTLSKIVATVFDKHNHIIHQRFLDNNGTAPSIQTIPNRSFTGQERKLIFNPFSEFDLGIALDKIEFQFTFISTKNDETIVKTVINPQNYKQKQSYVFPLKGKILVYDAHDYYSHHRRFDYEFAPIKQLGFTSNFMRYAYDFVMLDSANNQYVGKNDKPESYFGYGQKVYAVADGSVIYASNKHKDDATFDIPELANNALELYGNCIAIQHQDSSISIYGHLMQNSIKVKVGNIIRAKQAIASIGISGSSFFPHLHFEIRTSIKNSAEGLPSYFSNIFILATEKYLKLKSGLPETGSIITTK